jgi:hypothetical protein
LRIKVKDVLDDRLLFGVGELMAVWDTIASCLYSVDVSVEGTGINIKRFSSSFGTLKLALKIGL